MLETGVGDIDGAVTLSEHNQRAAMVLELIYIYIFEFILEVL